MNLHVSNGVSERPAYKDSTWYIGYRMEGWDGAYPLYLDFMFLDKTTRDINRAWVGTETQAKAVRRKYPSSKKLKLVRNVPPNNTNRG